MSLKISSLDVPEIKALLANNFLTPGSINANSLQTAMVLSGIFTEALWLSSRPLLGAQSTKTILMVLRSAALPQHLNHLACPPTSDQHLSD